MVLKGGVICNSVSNSFFKYNGSIILHVLKNSQDVRNFHSAFHDPSPPYMHPPPQLYSPTPCYITCFYLSHNRTKDIQLPQAFFIAFANTGYTMHGV